jgi:3-phosphoshikimate 1-carboxyvinyltransferase
VATLIVEEAGELKGVVHAPSSKSYTHRSIIAASLAEGESRISFPLHSDDTMATVRACSSLGAVINEREGELTISGASKLKSPKHEIDCGESASTIRFLTPVAALAHGKTVLTGSVGLRKRPIGPLVGALSQLGVRCFSTGEFPPVTVLNGGIRGGKASLVGDVSSQFLTGLLLACPMAETDTTVNLTTPLESKPYVKLTLDVIRSHGITVKASKDFKTFQLPKKQRYLPRDHIVPGDFSSAAFLLAAAAMTGSRVTVENLSLDQPDSEIVEILRRMGVNVNVGKDSVEVLGGGLKGVKVDARDIPDLVPVCTVLGCLGEGETRIYNAKRLRLKESNRLHSLSSELGKMGAEIVEMEDGLKVKGRRRLSGTSIDPHGDHRIAMACAVAGLRACGKTEILQAECVNKSYPNFFEDLKKLGARVLVN